MVGPQDLDGCEMAATENSTSRSSVRRRRARGSLSRAEILHAARTLIERDGLQQLSYPRLGKQLNAGPTSLYWYFPSKDDLLAALVDEVTKEMYLRLAPVGEGPWDEEIVGYHIAFRKLLGSTPVYRDVFAYRAQALFLQSRNAIHLLRSMEGDLAMFVRAGLSPDEAAHAFNAFSVFTRAFVLIEHGIDSQTLDQDELRMINIALTVAAADSCTLSSVAGVEQVLSFDDQLYRSGLRLLVAGLCERYPALRRTARGGGRLVEGSEL
jgi:AcrR family transcriptional regulator